MIHRLEASDTIARMGLCDGEHEGLLIRLHDLLLRAPNATRADCDDALRYFPDPLRGEITGVLDDTDWSPLLVIAGAFARSTALGWESTR